MKRARNSRRPVSVSLPTLSLVGASVTRDELGLPFISRSSAGEAHARFGEVVDTADLEYAAPQQAGDWISTPLLQQTEVKPSFIASVRSWLANAFSLVRT